MSASLPERGDDASSLQNLAIEDILRGRSTEPAPVIDAAYVRGCRVLITGAGGSIGSELARQIMTFHPAELVILDHDEAGLQQTQLSIEGHGLLDSDHIVLADIRDGAAISGIIRERRPEVVFHAAALKHLPLLQRYPEEGWKTNVLGTRNVVEASLRAGVSRFVNISTDKAADPTSVLGHTKRIAERITAHAAHEYGRRYVSVRFGNVVGSRGSMLPLFISLIQAGRPLTVTHPDVTRYFMTISEACNLVIEAGAIGDGGDVLILDMGEPVRILDIARRLIELSGRDVGVVFTGLRAGEKLHEDLVGTADGAEATAAPKIARVRAAPMSRRLVDDLTWERVMASGGADRAEHGVPNARC